MSQVRTRRNVTELTAVNFSDTISNDLSAAAVLRSAISNDINLANDKLIIDSLNVSSIAINQSKTSVVQSPVVLRNEFANSYKKTLTALTENVDTLTRQKMAVINTVSTGSYKIQSTETVKTGIKEVMKATSSEMLSASVEKMMNAVQTEHNIIFTNRIASVVERASIATGFSNVKVKQIKGVISVIALNEQGQSIVTDVKVDEKTHRVDLVSETIGIKDKSCNTLLNKFDKELEKAGLKYRKPDVEWKEGVQWMPDNPVIQRKKQVSSHENKDRQKKIITQKINH